MAHPPTSDEAEQVAAPSGLSPGAHRRTAFIAIAAVAAAVLVAQAVELLINRVLRPDAAELTWISEAIMAAAFLTMTALWERLRRTRRELSAAQRARVAIETQLSVAANVQRALLPQVPEPMDGLAFFAAVEPAGFVGGDYYDFVRLDASTLCVVVGDVSGKGIAAAVFLSNVRALVRSFLRESRSPSDVLAHLSDAVHEDSRAGLYVTCLIAVVDSRARVVTYSNAGHPPGVVLGAAGPRALDVGGPPAGLLPGARYQSAEIALAGTDVVVLVSDGITEALDVGGSGIPSALASAIGTAGPRTPDAVGRRLLSAARRADGPQGVAGWSDDRTVVAFGPAS